MAFHGDIPNGNAYETNDSDEKLNCNNVSMVVCNNCSEVQHRLNPGDNTPSSMYGTQKLGSTHHLFRILWTLIPITKKRERLVRLNIYESQGIVTIVS